MKAAPFFVTKDSLKYLVISKQTATSVDFLFPEGFFLMLSTLTCLHLYFFIGSWG
jgi:hypothetical protein